MVVTCALMDIRTSQAMDRSKRHHTLQFTFMSHRSQLVCVVENPRKRCPVFRSKLLLGWYHLPLALLGVMPSSSLWVVLSFLHVLCLNPLYVCKHM